MYDDWFGFPQMLGWEEKKITELSHRVSTRSSPKRGNKGRSGATSAPKAVAIVEEEEEDRPVSIHMNYVEFKEEMMAIEKRNSTTKNPGSRLSTLASVFGAAHPS